MSKVGVYTLGLVAISTLFPGCLATEGNPSGCGLTPVLSRPCICEKKLVGHTPSTGDNGPPVLGGTPTIRIPSEPEHLIGSIEPSIWGSQITAHDVLETLVTFQGESNEVEPELAESFEVQSDGLRYDFHLRKTAKWHDGEPFTADDVVFTFNVLSDPAQVFVRRSDFGNVREVIAIDTHTVSVKLAVPQDSFLESLDLLPIIPAHAFGRSIIVSNPASRTPLGTGPLAVKKWTAGKQIELVRHPHWDGRPINIDGLIYKVVPDERVARDMFAQGRLDISLSLGASVSEVGENKIVAHYPLPLFEQWIFNTKVVYFEDARVRRALSYAIDRDTILCSTYGCKGAVLDHLWFANQSPMWPHKDTLRYNLHESRKLLQAAGWTDSDGDGYLDKNDVPLSFTVIVPENLPATVRASSSIQYNLESLGIRMKIRKLSPSVYYQHLTKGQFDVAQALVFSPKNVDPWKLFHSEAANRGMNYGGFSNSEIDGIIDEWKNPTHHVKDSLYYDKLELALVQEAPWIPLFSRSATVSIQPYIYDWKIKRGRFEIGQMWLDGSKERNR